MEISHNGHASRWIRWSLVNFLLVSFLGITLRYKIAFSLPGVNFKYLLHAHSHFAFSGWVTTALFAALVHILQQSGRPVGRGYSFLFWSLQVSSFGMLLSFPFQGYGPVSIFFSALSMVFSWCFSWKYGNDMVRSSLSPLVQGWIRAALFFYILSGLGPMLLAYGMAHYRGQAFYFNAIYLFLHFQYNGWFTCGVAGLFFYAMERQRIVFSDQGTRWFFRLVVYSCLPAYCLSVLWMNPPMWVYAIATVAAIGQVVALAMFGREVWLRRHRWMGVSAMGGKWLWSMAGLAWSIKTVLQGLTVIPLLGHFAFGFRAVIIAYLHLVMLVFVSFFLLGFFWRQGLLLTGSRIWKTGLPLFVAGVLFNELFLVWEALPGWSFHFVLRLPYLLFGAACLIGSGLALICLSQLYKMKYTTPITLLVLLLLSYSAPAQTLVRGKVVDRDTKEPLCNATVACDCCHKGVLCTTCKEVTITDVSGSFSIRVTPGDRLRISCISYKDREVFPDSIAGKVVELDVRNDRMQEVVISANRTVQRRTEAPVAISMINAKTIADTKATQLDQLLNKASGVFMVDLGNEQHLMSIRQPMSTGNVFLYLEDGLPIRTSGIFNHNALLEMNQVAAHQIEIIRGPASALYGAEAIGGAVNVVTQAPPLVPAGRVSVQANNNGYRRIEGQMGTTLKKWGLIASGYYADRTDGPIQYSDFHKTAVTFRADYHASSRLNWVNGLTYVNYYSQMYGALDSLHFADRDYHTPYPFTYRKVEALRIRSQLICRWSSSGETQVLLSYRDNSIGQNPSYYISNSRTNPLLASGQVNVSSFHSYMLTAQHRQSIDRWNSQLIAGVSADISPSGYQARYIAIRRDGKGNYLDYSNTDSALSHYSTGINDLASYLDVEIKPFPGWKVTAAARYDHFHYRFRNYLPPSASTGAPDSRNDYSRLTPKVGITYNHQGLGFYVNYSQGYVPPQVSNLYNGVKVPYLQPQTFFNYEAGGWWSLWKDKLYADVSLYRLDGTNQIISIRQDDGTYQNANAGKTRHTGIEYGVTAKPSAQWTFRVSASHSDHVFLVQYENNRNYSGNQMAAAPHFLSNMELTWKPAVLKGFRAAVEWQHMGRYWMDDANTVCYKGFDVINTRIGYAFRRWEWWASGLNIFNLYYSVLATRSAYGYSYNPGTPREITLGMSWQLLK